MNRSYLAPFIFSMLVAPCIHPMHVSEETESLFTAGYNASQMSKNGEFDVIQYFIKANDIVFDVGAHKGSWSEAALARHHSLTLYAFEPIPRFYQILEKNNLIKAYRLALSQQKGLATFFVYDQFPSLSSLHVRPNLHENHGAVPTPITVTTETIDNFCNIHGISHIDFLKIDTEGNEFNVLTGAKGLLEKGAIRFIQFEYGGTYPDAGVTFKDVFDLLTSYGYHIYRIAPKHLIHVKKWHKFLENGWYSNYLASLTPL